MRGYIVIYRSIDKKLYDNKTEDQVWYASYKQIS